MLNHVTVSVRDDTSDPFCLPSVLPTAHGRATFVSMGTFIEIFMPPLPSDMDLDVILLKVKRARSPASRVVTKNGRLWGYGTRVPSQLHPNRMFSHIGACIMRVAKRMPGRTVTFLFQDDKEFGCCSCDSFPAAYFHAPRTEVSPIMSWSRIAVSGSYESSDSLASFDNVCATYVCLFGRFAHFSNYRT